MNALSEEKMSLPICVLCYIHVYPNEYYGRFV